MFFILNFEMKVFPDRIRHTMKFDTHFVQKKMSKTVPNKNSFIQQKFIYISKLIKFFILFLSIILIVYFSQFL